MATLSKLDLQKTILNQANSKIDDLVRQIMEKAYLSSEVVDIAKMHEVTAIVELLEKIEFDGDIQLLKDTIAAYDNAIAKIDEQLKAPDIDSFSEPVKESLKNAKEFFEKQSKEGRSGTVFSIYDATVKGENDGSLEKKYNDTKIEELDADIEQREAEEKAKISPYTKIINTTRQSREVLDRYTGILKTIKDIDKQIKDIDRELAGTGLNAEERTAKEEQRRELIDRKKERYKTARKDEKDKDFEIKPGEEEKDYLTRVASILGGRIASARKDVVNALEPIKGDSIEVLDGTGTKTKTIEEYLQDVLDSAHPEKLDDLTGKLNLDKATLQKFLDRQPAHKELETLRKQKQVYTDRNTNLSMQVYQEQKFDWRHPFKSFINMWKNRGGKQEPKVGPEQEKHILKEVEKNVRVANFRDRIKLSDKDKAAAMVEQTLNNDREEFYRNKNEDTSR